MATISIDLPDELAARAQREGLLTSRQLQALLEQALTRQGASQTASQAATQGATPGQHALLARSRSLWRHGDGLAWQQGQRAQWEREERDAGKKAHDSP